MSFKGNSILIRTLEKYVNWRQQLIVSWNTDSLKEDNLGGEEAGAVALCDRFWKQAERAIINNKYIAWLSYTTMRIALPCAYVQRLRSHDQTERMEQTRFLRLAYSVVQ
jgi:hypothetical protein